VQKQRGLQRRGNDICSQNSVVQPIQHAGVVEEVEDETDQAKDKKVRCLGRSPAPEKHIEPNGQIDQGNQPERLIVSAFLWLKKNRNLDRCGMAIQRYT
jgi:hypothetical protein